MNRKKSCISIYTSWPSRERRDRSKLRNGNRDGVRVTMADADIDTLHARFGSCSCGIAMQLCGLLVFVKIIESSKTYSYDR